MEESLLDAILTKSSIHRRTRTPGVQCATDRVETIDEQIDGPCQVREQRYSQGEMQQDMALVSVPDRPKLIPSL